MPNPHRLRPVVLLTALLLLTSGCTTSNKTASAPSQPELPQQASVSGQQTPSPSQGATSDEPPFRRDERAIRESEHNRATCFHLQPGATTTKVITQQVPVATAKAGKPVKTTAKKGQKAAAKAAVTTETKIVKTTGRCQPQSLIYARCRTGIATCKLGDTSPVQWFACAKKNNATSSVPAAGSVMVLDVNAGRGMPTGHPAYVEAIDKNGDGTWILRISHTNYDRKCHLDQDAKVLFDPRRMTASFETGPWGPWAKNLKVLGFILR